MRKITGILARSIVLSLFGLLVFGQPAHAFVLSFGSSGATTGDQKNFIRQLVAAFQKDYPGAVVELRDSTSYVRPILETLMEGLGESVPDLAVAGLVEWPLLHRKGQLRRFDSVLTEGELRKIRAGIRPELTKQRYGLTVEAEKYILPFNRAVPVLFVNADLLPEVASKTLSWDDVEAALNARRLATPNDKGRLKLVLPTDDWIAESILLNARGSATLAGTNVHLDDPAALNVVKRLRALVQKGLVELVPAQHEAYTDFIEGRAAFAVISLSTIKSIESRVKFPMKVLMPPKEKLNLTVLGGGDLIMPIGRQAELDATKKKDLKNFLTWFYTGKGSALWASTTGFLPLQKRSEKPLYEKYGWKLSSFYELDNFCNILFLRKGFQKAFTEALGSDEPEMLLKQAQAFLKNTAQQPCK